MRDRVTWTPTRMPHGCYVIWMAYSGRLLFKNGITLWWLLDGGNVRLPLECEPGNVTIPYLAI